MVKAGERNTPVKAKAVLVDPQSMTVIWANEAASDGEAGLRSDAMTGTGVDRFVPMAEVLGVPDALRTVADTGVAQHLRADLVSTARGSVAMVVSIYQLPDGMLLVLIENAWQVGERAKRGDAAKRPEPRVR